MGDLLGDQSKYPFLPQLAHCYLCIPGTRSNYSGMGGILFKESPLLDRPWREIKWGDKAGILQSVKDHTRCNDDQIIRILLYGPSAAGKSSFINSVHSVLHGRMYAQALTDNHFGTSFTRKYRTYRIQKQDGSFYPFVFNDIMGLGKTDGVLVDDVKKVLKGHVKDGYRFKTDTEMADDDPFYIQNPTNNDKVHVLVCVFDADKVSLMEPDILQKIRNIRAAASELEIPQVVVLTKIDEACPEIKKDIKCVYKDKALEKKIDKFSADTGIPWNYIFPVKNYAREIDLNDDIDCLILSVLRNLINFGEDCIGFRANQSISDD
ncbi:interferon-induced protein 44-like [Cheilinus undulatus]|uniref:interferon-induced protein 44-like n=1 Tax=Cheilinus undulatus TaxID=241271 RepID=UPI001BD46C80|nr:interferon-induced protein 44-like [Cheilinus undulatus]